MRSLMRQRTWRREVERAMAFVNASNVVDFKVVCSFHWEREAHPPLRLAVEGAGRGVRG